MATPQQPTSKGGPAFPGEHHPGMTLRDAIALVAMKRLIPPVSGASSLGDAVKLTTQVSTAAYLYADAMLVERMKKREGDEPPPKLAA